MSTVDDLANGAFYPVIDDERVKDRSQVERIVLCSGKVYYELFQRLEELEEQRIAVIRLEQLYPFPAKELRAAFDSYGKKATDLVWCGRSPETWRLAAHRRVSRRRDRGPSALRGASPFGSPATGSKKVHKKEQSALVEEATTLG